MAALADVADSRGSGDGGGCCGGSEEFRLKVITANTTGSNGLKVLLQTTDAHVVAFQEHWLSGEDDRARLSQWAMRAGWKVLTTPTFPHRPVLSAPAAREGGRASVWRSGRSWA